MLSETLLTSFLLWLNCVVISFPSSTGGNPLLLLVSFDGFRYDLLNNASFTPNIWQFAKSGVHFTNGVRPQYVTFTTPNHASITTGLFQQYHGIVGNRFYDPETPEDGYDYYNISGLGDLKRFEERRWYTTGGVPIWLSNERAGNSRRSASMCFPLAECDWPTPPHKPTFYRTLIEIILLNAEVFPCMRKWLDFKDLETLKSNADEIVNLFARANDSFNFVAWYVAEPDHVLHERGFYSGHLRAKLTELDELWGYLMRKLEAAGLDEKNLNIIFTSDHGHAQVEGPNNTLCLRDYILGDEIRWGDYTFYPKNETVAQRLYDDLTALIRRTNFGGELIWKKDFPDRFKYAASPRVGEIILKIKPGWAVSTGCGEFGPVDASTHGMDPDEWTMRAVLAMRGPAFRRNLTIAEIPSNVDLFPLMCRVLDIPETPNNGTMNLLKEALAFSSEKPRLSLNENLLGDQIRKFV